METTRLSTHRIRLRGANQPGYDSVQFSGNIGGPINKKSSFFFDFQRRNINDLSAINAVTLDPTTFAQTSIVQTLPNPRHRTNITPRLDYQLSKNNTLTVRYQYYRDTEDAEGIGQFTLPSTGLQLRINRAHAANQRYPSHRGQRS